MRQVVSSGASSATQQARSGKLLLLPQFRQNSSRHSLPPATTASDSCIDTLGWPVRPTALFRGGLVVVAAAGAVHGKEKKAKFSQQHPSKQELKKRKLKQLQKQQHQGLSTANASQQQQRDQSRASPQRKQGGQQQQSIEQKSKLETKSGKQQLQQREMEQQIKPPQLQPQSVPSARQPPPRQQLELRRPATSTTAAADDGAAGREVAPTATEATAAAAAAAAAAAIQLLPQSLPSARQPPPRQQLELIRPATSTAAAADDGAAGREGAATAAEATAAAAAAAAAAAVIQAADVLLPPAAAEADSVQPSTTTGSNGNSSPKQLPSKLAGISYALEESHRAGYRAAGVIVYDFNGPDMQPQLLLVREKTGCWNLPAGKISMVDDGRCSPDATASRELEEETHGLIPAADSRAVLNNCPVFYCHNSKMAIYLMRYAGGQQLPGLLEKRLAAGMKHPNAEGVEKLAWCTVDQVRRGIVYDKKRRSKSSASSSSKDPAAAAADEEEEEGEEDVAGALASLQLQDSSSVSTQQQQQQQPLEVRVPLYRNISRIRNWLDKLAKGQAPAPGLQVVQQQQEGGQPLSALAVQQIQISAKWAAYALGSSSSSSMLAAHAGAGGIVSTIDSSRGGQGFLSTGDSDSRESGALGQQQQQQPAGADVVDSSTGQQPWAIAVWSGQHARQQQQQQQ